MKRNLIYPLSVLLLMFVSLISCSSDDDSQDASLLCNTWLLVSYGNESNEVLKEAKRYFYIITFNPDGTYSGNIYGNIMGGEYTCNGHRITISSPKMTQAQMEGTDPDYFFLKHIDDVYSYMVTNTELRLYYSDNQYFKFRIE